MQTKKIYYFHYIYEGWVNDLSIIRPVNNNTNQVFMLTTWGEYHKSACHPIVKDNFVKLFYNLNVALYHLDVISLGGKQNLKHNVLVWDKMKTVYLWASRQLSVLKILLSHVNYCIIRCDHSYSKTITEKENKLSDKLSYRYDHLVSINEPCELYT